MFTAGNNQGTGYVTGSNSTASKTVTLSASGATVTASDGTNSVSKSVATVGRASTTLTSAKNSAGDGIVFTAGNNQDTGYVTGSNSTTTKTVTQSVSGATVTASDGTTSISKSVASGAYSASHTLTAGSGSASASGNISLTAVTSQPSSGYYVKATGSGTVSATGTATVGTAGYIAAGSKSSTSSSKSSNTATQYYSVPTGTCTVSGGGLSVGANYSGTPTVDISLNGQTTSGVTIQDSKPSSGYYLTIGASSSKLTGTTTVNRAAITDTHTAGYIPAKSATAVSAATTSSPSVTVNANSKTEYAVIPAGSCSHSGGGLAPGDGNVSATGTRVVLTEVSSIPSTGYAITVSGSGSVSMGAVTKTQTAGYIPGASSTTIISGSSKSSNVKTKYYTVTPTYTVDLRNTDTRETEGQYSGVYGDFTIKINGTNYSVQTTSNLKLYSNVTSFQVYYSGGTSSGVSDVGSNSFSDKGIGMHYTMNGEKHHIVWGYGEENTWKTVPMTGNIVVTSFTYESCLPGDTMIAMADGSEKRLDELEKNEMLLAVDPATGELTSTKLEYCNRWAEPQYDYRYETWTFEDGFSVRTVKRHRLYNIERQAMVYLDQWEVGEHAYTKDGKQVALLGSKTTYEPIRHYTLFTHNQNYFVNGLLAGNRLTSEMHVQ